MRVGIPTELQNNENRVAITPAGVLELSSRGHDVLVEAGAGLGSAITDEQYAAAGATIVADASRIWADAELVLKVKDPVEQELAQLRRGQVIFGYLHLAASRTLTESLLGAGVTAIAYETVQRPDGLLPLLAPMSEVAGRFGTIIGANILMKTNGGRGVLLGGVTATRKGKVVIIGGGSAGESAARAAVGFGAEVTVIDISLPRLKQLETMFDGRIQTRTSNALYIAEALRDADLVIGSVLIPGELAPKLVTDAMVAAMKPGAVLVDIAIDQGGCFENSRPTTHDDPTFAVHNSIYYCVANMPGGVPETSTAALTNATLPYIVAVADKGWKAALSADDALAKGLNAHNGLVANEGVAHAFPDLPNAPYTEVISAA